MALEPFETAASEDYPTVVQLSVFLDDRVGQLLRMTQAFRDTDIRIWGLMVVNSVDCAIVRMIVDDPDEAYDMLVSHRFPVKQTDVVVVRVPHGKRALLNVWSAVLRAEINIDYTYALMGHVRGAPTIAIHSESLQMACDTLVRHNFSVLSVSDLHAERNE